MAGERRYRAALEAGLSHVPMIVCRLSDEEVQLIALAENLQREDLNPLEETEGVLGLLALRLEQPVEEVVALLYRMDNEAKGKVTHNVMGKPDVVLVKETFDSLSCGTWQSFVANRLPLLKLPEDVLEVIRSGRLDYTKARAITQVSAVTCSWRWGWYVRLTGTPWSNDMDSTIPLTDRFIETKAVKLTGGQAEQDVWQAVKAAFARRESFGYWRYPVFGASGDTCKEPDILVVDRKLGLCVIEVKGIRITNLERIHGHTWVYTDFYERHGNPFQQAENQLYQLLGYCNPEPWLRNRVQGRVLVALPFVSRGEWEGRGLHKLPSSPPCCSRRTSQGPGPATGGRGAGALGAAGGGSGPGGLGTAAERDRGDCALPQVHP